MTVPACYIEYSMSLYKTIVTKYLSMVGVIVMFFTLSWYSVKIFTSSTHFFWLQPVDKNQRSLHDLSHLVSSVMLFWAR